MKRFTLLFIAFLSINDVFGDEVKSVSVMVGDSVTLHTDITEIQTNDLIDWRFGENEKRIAQINREANLISVYDDVLDGRFRDRLKLNTETGDLTITNINTQHTGDYKLEFSRVRITRKTFRVSVIDVDTDEMKSVSVMDGDSVTLLTDVLDIKTYDVIRWRFQHENSPLAVLNRNTAFFSTYDDAYDGRFRDKLQLNVQTGSLIITNITTQHTGLYEVDLSSTSGSYTIRQSFTVTVSGKVTTVSVINGDWVTLKTYSEIQTYDLIQWMFASDDDTRIAEINKPDYLYNTYVGYDGRFRNRLKLNDQTGDLTIINIRSEDAGLYELKMSSSRRSIQRRFSVHVSERGLSSYVGLCAVVVVIVALTAAGVFYYRHRFPKATIQTVIKGHFVRLKTDVHNIKTDDVIEWRFIPGTFQKTLIAKIQNNNKTVVKRFSKNADLNKRTGSLYISKITTDHSGLYELKITIDGKTSYKRFRVIVTEKNVSLKKKKRTMSE
ncbi:uncharacterized protein [Paramisgurnus dabryanus]|uniref:uncharacterized protein n=1 Tax=Paramisgurnus dabryanus TaxID=90735 RepID=UPI0031F3AB1D